MSSNSVSNKNWIFKKYDEQDIIFYKENYSLDFTSENYINRILPNIFLNVYKCHHVRVNDIKNKKKVFNASLIVILNFLMAK